MAEIHDVIAAFADGERVVPEVLKAALADADGREYLVELLVLRDLVRAAEPVIELVPERRYGAARWLAVAAALVVSVLGGYAAGRSAPQSTTPLPDAPVLIEAVQPVAPRRAPPATRVIHLEPGIDWKETVGG